MRYRLVVDGEACDLEVDRSRTGLVVRVDGAVYRARVASDGGGFRVRIGRSVHRVEFRGAQALVDGEAVAVATEMPERQPEDPRLGLRVRATRWEIRPPMPGRVVRIEVVAGGQVRRGQVVAVLEAMKMQNEIPAPADARVASVLVKEGESIATDRVIAVLESR